MRITESQLRRIIRQEVRSLHEGPGKKEVASSEILSQWRRLSAPIDGALLQWRAFVDVTNAEQDLKRDPALERPFETTDPEYRKYIERSKAAAKLLTHAKVEAALGDAVESMLGSGMVNAAFIMSHVTERAKEMGFREEEVRDIARAARSRLQAANIY